MTVPGTPATAPGHVNWLVNTGQTLKTSDGKTVEIWELQHTKDDAVLKSWAAHFREHYCLDKQLDKLRAGTGLSRAEFLKKIKFPDPSEAPGPSIRAGDFAEILASDYVEYRLGHWVPRTRYQDKTIRNESTKGSDVIGFKVARTDRATRNDVLLIVVSKAQLSGNKPTARLQAAIDDSIKDMRRKAESLNAIKQRLLDTKRAAEAKRVERFQNPVDHPYTERYGAVAVLASPVFDSKDIGATNAAAHPHASSILLIVIHGQAVMDLVHALYERAANEA
jgi:hypothetical protein